MLHPTYRPLLCHAKTPSDFILAINTCCEISTQGLLRIRYDVEIPKSMLVAAKWQELARADALWKTTCFEAFLTIADEPNYIELNFSPANLWAAYEFSDYRHGRNDLALANVPDIRLDISDGNFALQASVQLPAHWRRDCFAVGVSVIVEEISGTKSYWALQHQKAGPDFHDRAGFVLKLEAAPAL